MSGAARPTRRPAGRPPPSRGSRSGAAGRRRRSRSRRRRARARRRRRCSVTRAAPRRRAVSRAPGSCIGGSPGPPVTAPGGERVARDLGALAGQRRGEDLVGVAAGAAAAALAAAHDGDGAVLVEAQQLGEPQLEPGGDARRRPAASGSSRRARPGESIGARDAGALGEVAQREVHRLAQRLTRGPTAATVGSAAAAIRRVRYHVRRRSSAMGSLRRDAPARRARARRRRRRSARRGCAGCSRARGRRRARLPRAASTSSGRRPARSSPPTLAGGQPAEAGERRGAPRGPTRRADAAGRPARVGLGRALAAPRRGAAVAGRAVRPARAGRPRAGRRARARGRRCAPRRAPQRTLGDLGGHIDASAPRFDGRLRDRRRRPRAAARAWCSARPTRRAATVAEAVLASCAVPWIFAPVEIGGREYVDGGVWSPTNLDAAPGGRGAHVLCLVPTAGARAAPLRTATQRRAGGAEALALRARGAEVRRSCPDEARDRRDRART